MSYALTNSKNESSSYLNRLNIYVGPIQRAMRFYNNYNLKIKLSSLLVDQLSKTYPQMLLRSSGFIQAKLLSYSYIFEFLKKDQKTPIVCNEISIYLFLCNPIRLFHFTSELDCQSSSFSMHYVHVQLNSITFPMHYAKLRIIIINNGKPKMGFVFTYKQNYVNTLFLNDSDCKY